MDWGKYISDLAQKGAALGIDHGKMCSSCAFKQNSITQSELHNVKKALECLAYYGQFNCHINDYENAGKPCAGFLYAQEHLKKLECQ